MAFGGTAKVCTVPLPSPVKPSPTKKVWFSSGAKLVKDVPLPVVKSSAAGVAPFGFFPVVNRPTR